METRLASVADAAMLAALHSESFGAARWSETQIADSLNLPTTQGWIASDAGEAVGFILCQIAGAESEILTFCTAPAARRTGVGALLLAAVIGAARDAGAKRIFLDVAADNQAALALYGKAGFKPIGRRRGYYARAAHAADALILQFDL